MAELREINNGKEWASWTDVMGNEYGPGDIVAIATISGKSPQMVIARVEKINRVNSSGEEFWANKSFKLDEPVRHERECMVLERKRNYSNRAYYDRYYAERDAYHLCEPSCTEYWQYEEIRRVPSRTVKARPIKDARGFGRYSLNQDGEVKAVTYSIVENILFLEKG